jgi:ABC-type transport system involved in multi-copper enzyme maturation permease subunit
MMRLVRAEWSVVTQRPTAKAMMWVAVALAVVVVGIYGSLQDSSLMLNGKPIGALLTFSGPDAALKALTVRHFFVIPMFLLTLAGQTLAGERASHVMREQLVRSVARQHLLAAKVLSLWAFASLTLAAGLAVSLLIATPWLGFSGPWLVLLSSAALSLLTDLGVIAVGFMLSSVLRSTAAVVISGMMILGLDWALRAGLTGLSFLGVEWAQDVSQLMLGSALSVWSIPGTDGSYLPGLGLLLWIAAGLLVARLRLSRADIP